MDIDDNKEKESSNEEGTEQRTFDEKCSSAHVGEWNVEANHGAVANKSQGSGVVQVHQQQQQQPTQGSVFCWEMFLHVRSIRVLLVENDDSTRHVVTALLRNCNYEVANAANGLQAWKILEDLNNHIDIILTEVVMPCVSGISLLNKIMSHKTRKNIPVIMMSSHDSMGLVFKCLSKGAVDFLVKPIRKNELRNLWQHVWRRCHSSSGSESGTQTQKSVKAKGTDKSGNSTSNEGENNASNGLNDGDESDDGSEAQSSWTKQAVGMDISQALPPMDHVAECPDSTCAQVIRSDAEHSDDKRAQLSAAREGHGQQHPDTGKELETAVHRNVIPKSRNHGKGQAKATGRESGSDSDAADKLDIKNNATADSEEPKFEIGLKRLRGVQDTGRLVPEERCVLRRSEQSAFSRYNTSMNLFKSPNAITGHSSVLDNSNEVAKRESVGDVKILSNDHTMYVSNDVSNNVDMGSTTNNGMHHSTLRSLKNDRRYSEQQAGLLPNSTLPSSYQEIQIPHTHHHNFHSSPHFQNMENQPSSNHEESSAKQLVQDAPQCGSTNVLGRPGDINNMVNCCLNRSASGSNHGSNGQNGSSTAVNAVGNNGESDAGQAGKSDSGDACGSGSKNKAHGFRFTQREAALLKFRQKKKDRCFEKKVRYQARKRLADQRPRVRGQFVKQSGTGSSNRGVNE